MKLRHLLVAFGLIMVFALSVGAVAGNNVNYPVDDLPMDRPPADEPVQVGEPIQVQPQDYTDSKEYQFSPDRPAKEDKPTVQPTSDLTNVRKDGLSEPELRKLFKDMTKTGQSTSEKVESSSRLLVKFDSFSSRNSFLNSLPTGVSTRSFSAIPYVSVESSVDVQTILLSTKGIVGVTADSYAQVVDTSFTPVEDVDFAQWYNSEGHIGTWDMHDLGFHGTGVTVSIIDTGVDDTHPDLQFLMDGTTPKIAHQESFIDYDFDGTADAGTEDENGHGTHTSGTAVGNGYHIGVAPDAYLMNARALDGAGMSYVSWVVAAVEWSVLGPDGILNTGDEADVISMSIGWDFGYFGVQPALNDIVDWAWEQGVVVVIAAANSGPGATTIASPGMAQNVLTVAATDYYDHVALFSSRGPTPFGYPDPDIAAPGVEVLSSLPGGSYGIASGTSMATPHVAGAAAVLLDANSGSTPNEVKANMMANALDLGEPSTAQGAGLVDLVATHNNWDSTEVVVFPQYGADEPFLLSPGESYVGKLLIHSAGTLAGVPSFSTAGGNLTVTLDNTGLTTDAGSQYAGLTLTAPAGAIIGDLYTTTITESQTGESFEVWVEILGEEDDAGTGTDAGDLFSSAYHINPLANITGWAADNDFYKVSLTEGEKYLFVLDGMIPEADYDLALYNSSGTILWVSANWYDSPEYVPLIAPYTGDYYLYVMPYSVMYMGEGVGPYTLDVLSSFGGDIPSAGDLSVVGFDMYGVDEDNDEVFEWLAINITVDVLSPSNFSFYSYIALNKSEDLNKWIYAHALDEEVELTTTGVQTITLLLNGTLVADQEYVGPHVIQELMIGDMNTFTIIYDGVDVYTSAAIDSADYGPQMLSYVSLVHSEVDWDEDGLADVLEVNLTLDVLEDNYDYNEAWFTATLYHPDGWFFFSTNEAQVVFTELTTAVLTFWFDPYDFIVGGGNLELESIIIYSWDHPLAVYPDYYYEFPYIKTLGDTFTVNQTAFTGSAGGANVITDVFDYGLDEDNDGLFEALIFNITFSVVEEGYYSLASSAAVWSIGSQMVVWEAGNMVEDYFEAGTHLISLPISGELINSSGADGPYMLFALYLLDDYYGTLDVLYNVVTDDNTYEANDFTPAGMVFNQLKNVNYLDLDGDGQAESVELVVEVDVRITGNYSIEFNYMDYPYGYFGDYPSIDYWANNTGLQDLTVVFDGVFIWLMEYVGYIDLYSFGIYDEEWSMVYFGLNLGLAWVDYHNLPGAAPITVGTFNDHSIDDDGTNGEDYIIIELAFSVRMEGYYRFEIGLDLPGQWMYILTDNNTDDWNNYYEPGDYVVEFLLTAKEYVVYFGNGGLDIIHLLVDDDDWWSPMVFHEEKGLLYSTTEYNGANFQYTPMLAFAGSPAGYSATGVDEDSNSIYEGILFEVDVDVYNASSYDFELYLSNEDGVVLLNLWNSTDLTVGTHTIQFFLSAYFWIVEGMPLYEYNGFLMVDLIIANEWYSYESYDEAVVFNPYNTTTFDYSEFEYIIAATFTGDVYFSYVDYNNNGLIDAIDVIITIEVALVGEFELVIEMWADDGSGWYWEYLATYWDYYTASVTGEQNVTFSIESQVFTASGWDGPYQLYWGAIFYEDGFLQDEVVFDEYTDAIALSEFDFDARIIDITDYGTLTGVERVVSEYDTLIIEFTLEVLTAGYYDVYASVYAWDSYWGYYDYYVGYYDYYDYFEVGNHTVQLVIPASDIIDATDTDTDFEVYYNLENDNWDILESGHYYTSYYYYDEWVSYQPEGNIVGVESNLTDSNVNGLFEGVLVTVEVNVTPGTEYEVSFDVWAYDAATTEYVGYIGYYYTYFTAYENQRGLIYVEFFIPSADILDAIEDEDVYLGLEPVDLWDSEGYWLDEHYHYTQDYSYSGWEHPPTVVSFSDTPLDEDEDGKYEGLVVEFEIDFPTTGEYVVHIAVWANSSSWCEYCDYVGHFLEDVEVLTPGTITVEFLVPVGTIMPALGDPLGTDFEMWLFVSDLELNDLMEDGPFYTEYYPYDLWTDVITDAGSFTGVITGDSIDEDGNDLVDYLIFEVEVNVSTAGLFGIEYFIGDQNYDIFMVWSVNVTLSSPGLHMVELLVPVELLLISESSGPFSLVYAELSYLDTNLSQFVLQDTWWFEETVPDVYSDDLEAPVPPVLTVAGMTDGGTYSGQMVLNISTNEVTMVEIYLDGVLIDEIVLFDLSILYTLDMSSMAEGEHNLTIISWDIVDLSDSTTILFSVVHETFGPSVTANLTDGGSYNGAFAVEVTTNETGTGEVFLDGSSIATLTFASSDTFFLDTTTYADGTYNLTIVVVGEGGLHTTLQFDLVFDNTAPVVSFNIDDGDVLTGTTTIKVSSNEAATGTLYVDGKKVADVTVDSAGDFEYDLDTTQFANGSYKLKVVVSDEAGNEVVLEIEVTIENAAKTSETSDTDTSGGLTSSPGFELLSVVLTGLAIIPLVLYQRRR